VPNGSEWIPHAEKEFGRFTHAVGKKLPTRMSQLRATGRQLRSLTATTTRKPKR